MSEDQQPTTPAAEAVDTEEAPREPNVSYGFLGQVRVYVCEVDEKVGRQNKEEFSRKETEEALRAFAEYSGKLGRGYVNQHPEYPAVALYLARGHEQREQELNKKGVTAQTTDLFHEAVNWHMRKSFMVKSEQRDPDFAYQKAVATRYLPLDRLDFSLSEELAERSDLSEAEIMKLALNESVKDILENKSSPPQGYEMLEDLENGELVIRDADYVKRGGGEIAIKLSKNQRGEFAPDTKEVQLIYGGKRYKLKQEQWGEVLGYVRPDRQIQEAQAPAPREEDLEEQAEKPPISAKDLPRLGTARAEPQDEDYSPTTTTPMPWGVNGADGSKPNLVTEVVESKTPPPRVEASSNSNETVTSISNEPDSTGADETASAPSPQEKPDDESAENEIDGITLNESAINWLQENNPKLLKKIKEMGGDRVKALRREMKINPYFVPTAAHLEVVKGDGTLYKQMKNRQLWGDYHKANLALLNAAAKEAQTGENLQHVSLAVKNLGQSLDTPRRMHLINKLNHNSNMLGKVEALTQRLSSTQSATPVPTQ